MSAVEGTGDIPRERSSAADATLAASPGLLSRLGFGFTSVVETTKFQVYEIFLIFYYAEVLGLPGSLAGLAVAIAAIGDAVFDPLIGSYSDGLRSRVGRRHLLMYLAILPTGIFMYLLFVPPAGLGHAALFLWLLALSIAARVSASFYSGPAAAVGAEITDRATVRAELGIWRQAIAALSQVVLTRLIFQYAFTPTERFPRGQENPANYPKFALIVVGVVMLGALFGAVGTQKRILAFERERLIARARSFSIRGTLTATWRAFLDLANFRALFLGLLLAGLMGSYFRALNLSLGTYFWQLSTRETGNWIQSVQIATFLAAIASRAVVGRIEPRSLYVAGVAAMLAGYVLPPLARLLELMPPNGSAALIGLLYGANVAVGIGTGLIMSCSLVLFAECADEYALVKRESRTGMLLALLPLGNKLASSLGKLGAGVVIQWTALGPIAHSGPGAGAHPGAAMTPLVAPAAALRELGTAAVLVTGIAGLLALFFFLQYHLPRRRYAEILQGLNALRASQAGKEI